jgi:predicted ABC-type ATPase
VGAGEVGRPDAAASLRETLLEQGESFVFETVFSDPVGEKVAFLQRAGAKGYTVVLCFIGIDGPEVSEERFPRTLRNLAWAVRDLPHVLVFDNGDLGRPFRMVARASRNVRGRSPHLAPSSPDRDFRWLRRGSLGTPGANDDDHARSR